MISASDACKSVTHITLTSTADIKSGIVAQPDYFCSCVYDVIDIHIQSTGYAYEVFFVVTDDIGDLAV